MIWQRLDGSRILQDIKLIVEQTIQREIEQENELSICVGTDSQVRGDRVGFATVIVFLRKGKGGFMYINKEISYRLMPLKERLMYEASKSVGVAYDIAEILKRYNVPLEVHVDINTDNHFKSNIALKEAMGYIKGMGYVFKAKPNAFASSSCADKVC